ncbi:MAG: hypothetical protein JWL57_3425 [Actinobacteria bacterium]|jgi:hypothetical protein|nr:hypothetical protein [Actinomycetota bacterium]MEA2589515.1 hypothetical protein [Actinomycetota bacterium]
MKQPEMVKLEGPFEAEALRILRGVPGLTVTAEPGGGDRKADAVIHFAGQSANVATETKRRANAATAWQLVHEAEAEPDRPLLLIANETTAEAREILRHHGIAVIDGNGNTHLELPGLLVHLEGRRRERQARPTRLSGKAGIIAEVLLLNPQRPWRVQELAQEAGTSVGLAHRVLTRLEQEGVVAAEAAGRDRARRVTNPTALLDLWAEESIVRPTRLPAYFLAQTPQQLINEVGTNLGRNDVEYALTGAAAASLVAPYVTAVPTLEVWVPARAAPEELLRAADAERVDDGHNIVFLQAKGDAALAFRDQVRGLWIANRFRLYVDLRRDPRRGREQADHLRREVIGF